MYQRNFNEDWYVTAANDIVAELSGEGAEQARPVTLPHDAMVSLPRDAQNPSGPSGGFYPGGDYTYTKRFPVPADDADRTYVLELEGVYRDGALYVNGNYVDAVSGGYTRLIADITEYLLPGRENDILVKAMNSLQPNSRWYTGSGMYRPAVLHVGGPVHIDVDGVQVATPEVSREISVVTTEIALRHAGVISRKVMLRTEIRDGAGTVVASETTPVTLLHKARQAVRQRLYIRDAKLWSPDTPDLYACLVRVLDGETELDAHAVTFGVRQMQLDPVHGLRLNGESILLRGACVHHDNGVLGAATFAAAEARRIRLLKQAGFNAVRMGHCPASKAMLDACDRYGMLVLEEVFDTWNNAKCRYDGAGIFASCWERDIADAVKKDFNHPSVFMYSIGNEIQELSTASGGMWSRALTDAFRALDPTRYVTNAINGLAAVDESEMGHIMLDCGIINERQFEQISSGDVAAYAGDINDIMQALHGRMNELAAHPSIEAKLTEAYACLDACGLNYMRDCYALYAKTHPNRVTFGAETLPPDIAKNWRQVLMLPSCIGDFTWTGWDYIGEAGVGVVNYAGSDDFFRPYPAFLAYVGDVDITGFRRPMSYFREIVFGLRTAPYIAVRDPAHYGEKACCTPWATEESIESWSWPGYEGRMCKVDLYAAGAETALLLNDALLGRYATGADNGFHATAEIPYQPGKLEAVSYDGKGAETGRFRIETVGQEQILKVDCDVDMLTADADSLAFLMLSVVDANGTVHTEAERKIRVTVEGEGVLQGFGSANPIGTEGFCGDVITTYRGRALAVVRACGRPGIATITVAAEDGCVATLTLPVKERTE